MLEENDNLTIYDSTAQFEAEIRPLLDQITIKMKAYRIPFLFCAAVRNGEKREEPKKGRGKAKTKAEAEAEAAEEPAGEPEIVTEYEYEGNFCESNGIVLADDKLTDFLRITCGFKVMPVQDEEEAYTLTMPGESIEMDYGDEGIDEINAILAGVEDPG